ncbi:MAG: type I-E CRISPR-associated protein Cse2/CasB [Acidobacteria bacterium]|nr:type I-E CRISPR-associated protein Cse2/CasB [Acidobacteriota bacterium]
MIETAAQTNEQKHESGLIAYLHGLAKRKDRAALAHLRRGLGKKPGDAMEMYPYVGRFAGERSNEAHERAVFLTAALFADYPDAPQNAGDLGSSVKQIAEKSDSIERRFVALLDADAKDLHYYLRQMFGLLKGNSVPVNWDRLFKDVRNWSHDDRFVQRNWARSFWGSRETKENNDSETTGGIEQ